MPRSAIPDMTTSFSKSALVTVAGLTYSIGVVGGFISSGVFVDRYYASYTGPGIVEIPLFIVGSLLGGSLLTYPVLYACFRFARKIRSLVSYLKFILVCPLIVLVTSSLTAGIAVAGQAHMAILADISGSLNLIIVAAFSYLLVGNGADQSSFLGERS
jgi:hypothetical protein